MVGRASNLGKIRLCSSYKFVQNPIITMSRLIQIIRNSFIRLEGLIYQIFGFFSKLFGQLFNFLSKVFGFTESQYFLEDSPQGIKPSEAKPDVAASAPQNEPNSEGTTRRRPDANMDYYLKLARQEKTSK